MQKKQRKMMRLLLIPVLALAATAAYADPARYSVSGAPALALWALGDQPGTEAILYAFSQAKPETGESPAAGPRMVFSVTQWQWDGYNWTRRQWYGDAPLQPETMAIPGEMNEATLDATVMGTLEERTAASVEIRREVPGRIQVRWSATGGFGNSTSSFIYQTPAYTTQLQMQGEGRQASATGTVTVEAMGAPMTLWGFGSLSNVTDGTLSVTVQ